MNKIKRSLKLLQAAFAVLFREKKLLLFPLIATVLANTPDPKQKPALLFTNQPK